MFNPSHNLTSENIGRRGRAISKYLKNIYNLSFNLPEIKGGSMLIMRKHADIKFLNYHNHKDASAPKTSQNPEKGIQDKGIKS